MTALCQWIRVIITLKEDIILIQISQKQAPIGTIEISLGDQTIARITEKDQGNVDMTEISPILLEIHQKLDIIPHIIRIIEVNPIMGIGLMIVTIHVHETHLNQTTGIEINRETDIEVLQEINIEIINREIDLTRGTEIQTGTETVIIEVIHEIETDLIQNPIQIPVTGEKIPLPIPTTKVRREIIVLPLKQKQ